MPGGEKERDEWMDRREREGGAETDNRNMKR